MLWECVAKIDQNQMKIATGIDHNVGTRGKNREIHVKITTGIDYNQRVRGKTHSKTPREFRAILEYVADGKQS